MSVRQRWLAAALVAAVGAFAAPDPCRTGLWAQDAPLEEVGPRDITKVHKRIEAALKVVDDTQFHEIPVVEFANEIERKHGIQIEIDRRVLHDAAIDPEAIVLTISMKNMSLGATLHHALAPFGLDYKIADGVLLITTREAAASHLVTEMYPAVDLVMFKRPDGSVYQDVGPLIGLITSSCHPASWREVGGPGSIAVYDGLLVVNQSRYIQKQIAAFLVALRSAIKAQEDGAHSPKLLHGNVEQEAKIHSMLERPMNIKELIAMPIDQLTAIVAQRAGINVLIDGRALQDVGIDFRELSVNGRDIDVPLHAMLERLRRDLDLSYMVQEEALVVTTRERAAATLTIRIYPAADLVVEDRKLDTTPGEEGNALRRTLMATVDAANWSEGGGASSLLYAEPWQLLVVAAPEVTQRNLAERIDQLREAIKEKEKSGFDPTKGRESDDALELRVYALPVSAPETAASAAAEVSELIRETIAPESWQGEPQVYMKALADRVVIRHRRSVHEQVGALLRKLENPRRVSEKK